MPGDEFKSVVDFEEGLKIDDVVCVHWTNSHRFFHAKGVVKKINSKSIFVTLTEGTGFSGHSYPIGHCIKVPLISDIKRWTANNRVWPISDTGSCTANLIFQKLN